MIIYVFIVYVLQVYSLMLLGLRSRTASRSPSQLILHSTTSLRMTMVTWMWIVLSGRILRGSQVLILLLETLMLLIMLWLLLIIHRLLLIRVALIIVARRLKRVEGILSFFVLLMGCEVSVNINTNIYIATWTSTKVHAWSLNRFVVSAWHIIVPVIHSVRLIHVLKPLRILNLRLVYEIFRWTSNEASALFFLFMGSWDLTWIHFSSSFRWR